jgi:hypothetical protein
MTLKGRCLCGDVRYQIDSLPTVMGVCHCKDCQRQGGSAFSCMAGVPKSEFAVLRGTLASYSGGATESGDTADNRFCPRCGSPIYTELDSQPGLLFLKVGTLDDTDWFEPQFHVWHEHSQQWVAISDIVPHRHTDGV